MQDSLINKIKESRCIVVLGMPASGKTYVAVKVIERFKPNAVLISTDDFIDDEDGLEKTIQYWNIKNKHIIIEGCEAYDLLDSVKPEMILDVKATDDEINSRYQARQKTRPTGFEKHLQNKFNRWCDSYISNKKVMPYVVPVTSQEFDA